MHTFRDGDFFGEIALLSNMPRGATVRARTACDLVALDQPSFSRILHDHPQFADGILRIARERYDLHLHRDTLLTAAR